MKKRIVANLAVAVLGWIAVLPLTVLGQPSATEIQLPDGDPKALIEATCVACHQLDYIPNSRGYTQEGWRGLGGGDRGVLWVDVVGGIGGCSLVLTHVKSDPRSTSCLTGLVVTT